MNRKLLIISISIALFLLCLYFQYFVYIPGNEIYLTQLGKIADKVVLILEFLIGIVFYCLVEVKYINVTMFVLVVAVFAGNIIFFLPNYISDLRDKEIDKDPYVTIGIVAKLESTRKMDRYRVYYDFKDLEGSTTSSLFHSDRIYRRSDTFLVIFSGQHPNANKIYSERPLPKEINQYKDGPKPLH